ncbi:MAG TPA: flagellar hook protein FlgE [Gemmatimonadaceae bacterium]|nr:flagellar hook protein FlgE [Gemmatimonadaceae bacterium]
MLRSLSSAVAGLRNQQTRMDVIGNNVSNVNTVAFKAGRVTFKEGFAQMVESASRATNGGGGTNPMQVGLGSQIGSLDTMFTQGNLETTGRNTDLAIQGNSFFVVKHGAESFYTRAGNFQVDSQGTLVAGTNGFAVQGRMATNGKLGDTVSDLKVPIGQTAPANATTKVTLSGNVDASAKVFDKGAATTLDPLDPVQRALPQNANAYKDMSITAYDSLGTKHELKMVMWKTDADQWDWKFDDSAMDITSAGLTETAGTHPITFNTDGSVDTTAAGFVAPTVAFTPNGGAADVAITIDLGSGVNGLSQFAGSSTAVMRDQDGYTNGVLDNFTIDASGTIVGSFTNGTTQALGQILLSDFNNPEGLTRRGDNLYSTTANSGSPVMGYAGEGSTSSIASGALEMSNVDLAQEFTNMIVAQRGFQANGRVITTSDQMLQELVQLKS